MEHASQTTIDIDKQSNEDAKDVNDLTKTHNSQ